MNILEVNTKDHRGGAAQIFWSLKEGLRRRGDVVTGFVSQKISNDPAIKTVGQSRTRKLLSFTLSNDIVFYNSNSILASEEFRSCDVVHLHNISGHFFDLRALVAMGEKKPVLWTFHDMYPIDHYYAYSSGEHPVSGLFDGTTRHWSGRFLWYNKQWLKKTKLGIYRNARFGIAVPSEWLKQKVEATPLAGKEITVVYNGIDIGVFHPRDRAACRAALGLPQDKKIVMFVSDGGMNNSSKGGWYAAQAMASLKNDDVCFMVIGGSTADAAQKNILSIPFVKDRDRMAEYFCAADCFLYTPLFDNMPLVVLEAMACGTPIVGFRTGGIPEAAREQENGFFAEAGSCGQLVAALKKILALPHDDAVAMGARSVKRISEEFTEEGMVSAYADLYKKTIADWNERKI